MRFLIFLLGFALAIVIIVYRYRIQEFTGEIPFAEKYLGSGGTNSLIVIIAVLVFIGSLMYSLGTLDNLVQNTIGKLF